MFDDQKWIDAVTTLVVVPLLALLIGVVGTVLIGPVGIVLALVYLVWRFAREA